MSIERAARFRTESGANDWVPIVSEGCGARPRGVIYLVSNRLLGLVPSGVHLVIEGIASVGRCGYGATRGPMGCCAWSIVGQLHQGIIWAQDTAASGTYIEHLAVVLQENGRRGTIWGVQNLTPEVRRGRLILRYRASLCESTWGKRDRGPRRRSACAYIETSGTGFFGEKPNG